MPFPNKLHRSLLPADSAAGSGLLAMELGDAPAEQKGPPELVAAAVAAPAGEPALGSEEMLPTLTPPYGSWPDSLEQVPPAPATHAAPGGPAGVAAAEADRAALAASIASAACGAAVAAAAVRAEAPAAAPIPGPLQQPPADDQQAQQQGRDGEAKECATEAMEVEDCEQQPAPSFSFPSIFPGQSAAAEQDKPDAAAGPGSGPVSRGEGEGVMARPPKQTTPDLSEGGAQLGCFC